MGNIFNAATQLGGAVSAANLGNGRSFDRTYTELSQATDAYGQAIAKLAKRVESEFPANPGVVEDLTNMAGTMRRIAATIGDCQGRARRAHQTDWERLNAPRRGEKAWDKSINDG